MNAKKWVLSLPVIALLLAALLAGFNYVTDPGLIEAGIYDINALKSRYDFLLRKMKLAQGQAVPSRCPEVPTAEPACMPAGNVKGGPSCPS